MQTAAIFARKSKESLAKPSSSLAATSTSILLALFWDVQFMQKNEAKRIPN